MYKMKLFELHERKVYEEIKRKRKRELKRLFDEMFIQIRFHFRYRTFSFKRPIDFDLKKKRIIQY